MDPTLTWVHTPSNSGWVVCQKMSHKKSGTNNITHWLISRSSDIIIFYDASGVLFTC